MAVESSTTSGWFKETGKNILWGVAFITAATYAAVNYVIPELKSSVAGMDLLGSDGLPTLSPGEAPALNVPGSITNETAVAMHNTIPGDTLAA